MARWLKLCLIAVLAFHAAVAVVDGRRCSMRGDGGCAKACGPCASPGAGGAAERSTCEQSGQDSRCRAAAQVCEAICGEDDCCPEWACLLCRCDDRTPPSRQPIPDPPKFPAPAKPAFIVRDQWRDAMQGQFPVIVARAVLSPPARLAVLCIWRL